MKTDKTRAIPYRRKRKGKTNYNKRLKILLSGKPRLVVRKSLSNVTAQIIEYNENGDRVLVCAKGTDLKKMGWKYSTKNTSCSYLVGLLLAKKATEKGVKEAVLDIGLNKSVPGSRLFSVLKGTVDGGLNVPHSDNILPKEERILGKHIEGYANNLKKDESKYKKNFGGYLKNGADPSEISKAFNDIKNKIGA